MAKKKKNTRKWSKTGNLVKKIGGTALGLAALVILKKKF